MNLIIDQVFEMTKQQQNFLERQKNIMVFYSTKVIALESDQLLSYLS